MAKFITFPPDAPAIDPNNTKVNATLAKDMLRYLQTKYGNDPVDQFELMVDLNKHQEDGTVTKEKTVRPLSQSFGFLVPEWHRAGQAVRLAAKALEATAKQPGKITRMENQIRTLEAKLAAAGIEYTPFQWDAVKAPAPAQQAA